MGNKKFPNKLFNRDSQEMLTDKQHRNTILAVITEMDTIHCVTK